MNEPIPVSATDDACSVLAAEAGEPLAGTAPIAQAWVIIEQPGPWGRLALTESHLDPELGARIAARAEGTGTSVLLARHPDRSERTWSPADRRVWVAHVAPGNARVRTGVIADARSIASWDFSAIAVGSLPPVGVVSTDPTLFVCTNGSRDACCAQRGRSLVDDLLTTRSGTSREQVWEANHLVGHRFAPTALLLPTGGVYGRLDATAANAVIDDPCGDTALRHARGRSAFPQPLQAAELAVRRTQDIHERDALDALWVIDGKRIPIRPGVHPADTEVVLAEIRHDDGRAWLLKLKQRPIGPRPESCGAGPVPGFTWEIVDISPTSTWRHEP